MNIFKLFSNARNCFKKLDHTNNLAKHKESQIDKYSLTYFYMRMSFVAVVLVTEVIAIVFFSA